jgi:hypothetical protein
MAEKAPSKTANEHSSTVFRLAADMLAGFTRLKYDTSSPVTDDEGATQMRLHLANTNNDNPRSTVREVSAARVRERVM